MSVLLAALLLMQEPAGPADAPADRFKELRENNIFSPPKPKRDTSVKPANPSGGPRESEKPSAPKPDPIVLTGLSRAESGEFEALIEDKKKKEVRWCKPGDTVEGWTIVSLTHEELVARKGTEEKKLRTGEALVGELPPPPIDPKVLLGEAESDPRKIEEARKRMQERMKDKKTVVEEVPDDGPVRKKPRS